MNVLFLSLLDFESIDEHNIYTDLLREFYRHGHTVCAISPVERRNRKDRKVVKFNEKLRIAKPRIGNIQKTNIIEKGISTLTIEKMVVDSIKKNFPDIKFDVVLYTTPPITLQRAVEYVKKRDGALTYLMLKDIFPQNAVDLGMLSKTGPKKILYKFFRRKEKKLYQVSDYIGCMSKANVDYVLQNNQRVDKEKVEVCPNGIEVRDFELASEEKMATRDKYGIPQNRLVFVYGGNLGKPQGIDFMIECLKSQRNNDRVFFLIVGSGTECDKVHNFIDREKQENVKFLQYMQKEDYDKLVMSCDVGMIFLDYRFTIPNFPSRVLSYMQAGLPVFAVTDEATDIGDVIVDGQFGWRCSSNDIKEFEKCMKDIMNSALGDKGEKGKDYLRREFSSEKIYQIVSQHIKTCDNEF